jgi:hypothetical protein
MLHCSGHPRESQEIAKVEGIPFFDDKSWKKMNLRVSLNSEVMGVP